MAKFFITGGAGFIGFHITETLIEGGNLVRVLDNLSTGRGENVASFLDHVEFIEFGPRQDPTSEYAAVIPKFITSMLGGGVPTIYGDGTQSRDFTYVSNVVAGNLLVTTAPEMVGCVFNAVTSIRYTLPELVARLNEILVTLTDPLFASCQPGDVKHSQSDISSIEANGYQAKIDFWAGLQRTVEWYSTKAV